LRHEPIWKSPSIVAGRAIGAIALLVISLAGCTGKSSPPSSDNHTDDAMEVPAVEIPQEGAGESDLSAGDDEKSNGEEEKN
jgi:hypothetical protein